MKIMPITINSFNTIFKSNYRGDFLDVIQDMRESRTYQDTFERTVPKDPEPYKTIVRLSEDEAYTLEIDPETLSNYLSTEKGLPDFRLIEKFSLYYKAEIKELKPILRDEGLTQMAYIRTKKAFEEAKTPEGFDFYAIDKKIDEDI